MQANPVVFLDISLNTSQRLLVELFADQFPTVSPKQFCEKFRQLFTGEYRPQGKPLGYKGCRVDRVVQGSFFSVVQELEVQDWELSELKAGKHSEAGLLGVVPEQLPGFYVTLGPCRWMDTEGFVVGRLEKASLKVLEELESLPLQPGGKPVYPVVAEQCGQM